MDSTGAQSISTQDYWPRLQVLLPKFGISRVADITGLDHIGFPVAQAVRPDAHSNAVTQGKAATLVRAAIGATLECLEMAAGEDLSRLPTATGAAALWSGLAAGAPWPDAGTVYVRAWDIAGDRDAAVPRDLISTDFAKGAAAERAPILRHSIGLGAGTTLGASLMHGLQEAIEADARIRAEATGLMQRLRLDPDDEAYSELLGTLTERGLRCAAWQMPAKGGLCAVKASVMDRPGASALPLPATGYAARPAANRAIAAALAEAVQARLAVISGAREDITQRFYQIDTPPQTLAAVWDTHEDAPAIPVPLAPASDPTLRHLAASVSPVFAVILHWDPAVPLAITRIVAPSLIADPMSLGATS